MFTSVGGKAAVLKLAFDWALAGDDEPVAIADRPEVRRMMQQQDPAVLLADWVAMNAAIAGRLAALHHVLVVAADADPEAAALLATTEQQRTHGARAFVTRLEAIGGLRPELDVDRATAIAELLMDPMPYRRLVLLRGWTPEEYTEYLQQNGRSRPAPVRPSLSGGGGPRSLARRAAEPLAVGLAGAVEVDGVAPDGGDSGIEPAKLVLEGSAVLGPHVFQKLVEQGAEAPHDLQRGGAELADLRESEASRGPPSAECPSRS